MSARQDTTITLSQIAELAGVRPSAVSNWRTRFDDFPRPSEASAGGRDLFSLADVEEWLRCHDRLDPARTNERLLFGAMDLLRGQASGDEGIVLFASAIALVEAVGRTSERLPSLLRECADIVAEHDPVLRDVFADVAELDDQVSRALLELAATIPDGVHTAAFEWVLRRRTRFVETRTSDELVTLFVELAGDARSVFDPTAGEGGLLTAVARRSRGRLSLFGQEINRSAWRLAKQRLLMHRVEADLWVGDSLREDQFPELRVDAVLCDPPYSLKLHQESLLARWPSAMSFGALKSRTADFLWIEHAIEHLAEEGRAYVLVPASTLWARGREREIRSELIRRGAVEAIITIPPGSAQYTGIPLALWIVRRPQTARPVLVVDGGGNAVGERRTLDGQLSTRIGEVVREWRELQAIDEEHHDLAAAVAPLELLGSDATLIPSRWVDPEPWIDLADRRVALAQAFAHLSSSWTEVAQSEPKLSPQPPQPTQWVSVRDLVAGDVAEVVRGVRVRPDDCLDDGVPVLRTRDVKDTLVTDEPCFGIPERMKPKPTLTEPGDIVVSPASGKLRAIVDETGGHILATPLQALRFRTPWLDPHVAAAFLESPQNRRFAKGMNWGYARVDLRDLELPHLRPKDAERLRETLDRLTATERKARELAMHAEEVRRAMLDVVESAEEERG